MAEMEFKRDTSISQGWPHSMWVDTTPKTTYPALESDLTVDTVVIGGGIVGLTTALLLKEAGHHVALVDLQRIIEGVSGHTTAKVTVLHGLRYQQLIDEFSKEQVLLYAKSNLDAVGKVADFVARYKIDCDLKLADAYTYTEIDEGLDSIHKEVEATQKLGLPSEFVESTPLPFDIKGAIKLGNQAQFHPRKYLLSLAKIFSDNVEGSAGDSGAAKGENASGDLAAAGKKVGKGTIFENTRVIGVEDGSPCTVKTTKNTIKAQNVVLATTFPVYDSGGFFAKLYPYTSYVIGLKMPGAAPEGMYYTEDETYRTIRNQIIGDDHYLIIGGGRHKTGQGGDSFKYFTNIMQYAGERLTTDGDIDGVRYLWSTEDYSTQDHVPYVGLSPKTKHVYMGTGFGGWGMTNGTAAAILISDLILSNKNPAAELFDPSRHSLLSQNKESIAEGINVVGQYAKELFVKPEKKSVSELGNDEGDVIMVNDKKVAAYKDKDGNLFTLSPKCTHMGCQVNFNNTERTWDCTCHGSRFNFDGTVIQGPATHDLKHEEV
jgi:glycine/D-amino acid oxidase-like deaminating enzyme/nitrite reductase/ring-hydroxylating ferredoxin subunit